MQILVVDIETGTVDLDKDNWDIANCMICEVGIAELDTTTGSIAKVFDEICQEQHGCHPDSWVFNNTDLTYAEVIESDYLSSYKATLQKILDEDGYVTSWGHDFDLDRLEHKIRGFNIPNKFWDPKITLTEFMKIEGPYGYKWPSVQEVYVHFNPRQIWHQNHRAIDDAVMEAELIYKSIVKWPELIDSWEKYLVAS